MNIDKPLDDIIGEKRKSRAPRRARPAGGARKPSTGNQNNNNINNNAKAAAAPAPAVSGSVHVGDKIIVSGLPTDVNEAQVRELFQTTVGPLRSCVLTYDARGQFKGTATVHFRKAEHATKAYSEYNKRVVDGSRPMRVEIIVDPSRAAASQPLTARLGAAPAIATPPVKSRAAKSATVAAAGGSAVQTPRNAGAAAGGASAGGRRGAGGRGRRGGRRGAGEDRPAATAEALDAEMSDWQAQASTSNGAAATA
ncbi:hypothetical protein JCM10908_005526 [Rhodotorula pacifica]|uniref:RNA-binding protein YRA1 n=1 Tax=Rhodotorula pacifica TaxID=1495444 RepID=UPI00316F4B71